MHELRYQIWSWGEATGEGSNDQFAVGVSALAKRSRKNPFEIANEVLCMRLAIVLPLPVPFGIVLHHEGQDYFTSLKLAIAGEALPPATNQDIERILAAGDTACGIIVFDSWICNEDRKRDALTFDDEAGTPLIFDHGSAFYDPKHGAKYFEDMRDTLGIHAGNHCLAGRIKEMFGFGEWEARIKAVPEHYIEDAVDRAIELGIPPADKAACVDFLLDRRQRLRELFCREHKTAFPRLDHGLFDPFAMAYDFQI